MNYKFWGKIHLVTPAGDDNKGHNIWQLCKLVRTRKKAIFSRRLSYPWENFFAHLVVFGVKVSNGMIPSFPHSTQTCASHIRSCTGAVPNTCQCIILTVHIKQQAGTGSASALGWNAVTGTALFSQNSGVVQVQNRTTEGCWRSRWQQIRIAVMIRKNPLEGWKRDPDLHWSDSDPQPWS